MSEKEQKPTEEKRNVIALFWSTLFKPKATFSYLKENRKKSWWLPAFAILLLTLAPIISAGMQSPSALPAGMGGPTMTESSTAYEGEIYIENEAMPGGPGMPMQPPGPSGPNILAMIGVIVGTPLAWIIWSGALYLASVFLGRSSGFREMFRLTVWGWIPYAVRGAVQSLYITLTGEAIINPGLSGLVQSPAPGIIPLGPGRLMLASVLSHIDIYMIWRLLVTSAGLIAFTQLPPKKARIAILSIWLILVLLGSVPAIMGGMFGIAS